MENQKKKKKKNFNLLNEARSSTDSLKLSTLFKDSWKASELEDTEGQHKEITIKSGHNSTVS